MKKQAVLVAMVVILILSGCTNMINADEMQQFRLAHSATESHPAHQSMLYFADSVYEKSNGDINIEVYANEQLGSERETVELLQAGAIDFAQLGAGNLESFSETYSLFSLPYLFDNEEHYHQAMDSEIAEYFYQSTEEIGFKGLSYYDAGARSFYTNKAIERPDDLAGLKLRVQPSETILAMMNAFGVSATPMSYGEVYTGLQQGVIDGAENSELNVVSTGHYEVISDFSHTEHIIAPDVLNVSNITWENFSEAEKQMISEASEEATEMHKALWAEETSRAIEEAEASGIEFHHPDKEPFIEAVEPLHDRYSSNEETGYIYEQIRELVEGD
ncbi:TRAP transporter substrate-binding protein [Salicibibacter cibarius]|uniref:TRAP transporter substrate-binding protein n=1 Tax=Salicibibacter cibarius TaxID=2743000 RepID=A0A7T6Z1Q3_9BACI|nr:TRAP transporter substrate-binding protein [Salicibibacter cibarius]QQK75373.1 TRAP transporter substrate-binding protein [Salicibibacter cibarius]